MKFEELINICIDCIQKYNPVIEIEDSFADRYLKKVNINI